MSNKLLFILNPISGKANIKQYLLEILNYFSVQQHEVTVFLTQYQGHAYELALEFGHDYEKLVCAGGNGTLSEVISGIIDSGSNCNVGYIPFGSTNDFATAIGLTSNFSEILELSIYGNLHLIDVGKCNDQHFLIIAAFGIFTKASYLTPQKSKNLLGYWAYLLEGVKQISELKSYHLSIAYDSNQVEGNYMIGVISNTLSIAGFRNPLSRMVSLNDGLFEVFLIEMPNNILELRSIILALLSEKPEHESFTCFQANTIIIEGDEIEWTLDGEFGGIHKRSVIVNHKNAVQIYGN